MADDTPPSRFKPKGPPKKFSWTGNNTPGRFRNNSGTANVTGSAGSRPTDAGGFEKPLSAADMAQITQRYGGGNAGTVAYPPAPVNHNLTTTPPAVPPNPNLAAAPPVATSPAITGLPPVPPTGDYAGASFDPVTGVAVPLSSGEGAASPVGMRTEPALPPNTGDFDAGGGGYPSGTNANTGSPIAQKTPQEVVDEEKALFKARGGSNATWNRAQVAAGRRPEIDARSTPSSLNSNASSDIWQQMTADFNQRTAGAQSDWIKKFSDARDKLAQQRAEASARLRQAVSPAQPPIAQ